MPQKSWSKKDERMYEHIEPSQRKEGPSKGRAKQIAAATGNTRRKQEGRSKQQKSK